MIMNRTAGNVSIQILWEGNFLLFKVNLMSGISEAYSGQLPPISPHRPGKKSLTIAHLSLGEMLWGLPGT